ncbi:hypothetical protein UJ101_00117 [Flavobacteriaceae bacterium UJ101]|nr:hypothetical protein UJ101_00117 [Flavobacteriaceae bacterium UJ101]
MENIFNHQKLQEKIDRIASESGLKSVLVMKSHPEEMEVVLSGGKEGKEIYHATDRGKKSVHPEGKHPLYCEKVVNTNQILEVQDASIDEEWKYNEDLVEFGLGTYLGLPIEQNGEVVGTVCALHDERFDFREQEGSVLNQLKEVKEEIENQLI